MAKDTLGHKNCPSHEIVNSQRTWLTFPTSQTFSAIQMSTNTQGILTLPSSQI